VGRSTLLRKPVTDLAIRLTSVISTLAGKDPDERSKVSSIYEQSVLYQRAGIQASLIERDLSDAK
jgi:hypothetical protein